MSRFIVIAAVLVLAVPVTRAGGVDDARAGQEAHARSDFARAEAL